MMLAKRIIPCLDVRNGRTVKGQKFTDIKDVEDPAVLAKRYALEGADELVFYDITASNEKRQISLEFVEKVAREIDIPFSVGGGVKTIEDFVMILHKGADKVSVNSAAVHNPNLIKEAAARFGSQCVVLSIDAKKVGERYLVYTEGGRNQTDLDAVSWAEKGVALGAGEIVINAMDADGMKQGYDIELLKHLKNTLSVPIIASGGAGEVSHFIDAAPYADGLLAASVFHFGEIAIETLKQTLHEHNIPVRLKVR